MRICYGSDGLKLPPSALALGDFDAIHKGHQVIIKNMIEHARENELLSVVYMFSSHPNKNLIGINTLSKRLEILENMGVDCCVVEDFTPEYKNTSCVDFVEDYIKNRLSAMAVFVGFNYRFGKGADGNVDTLKTLCKNAEVFVTPCIMVNEIPISSTAIKTMIEEGKVDLAYDFMGRFFSVKGRVIKGKQLGRTIGFPTANMEYPRGTVIPKEGVYITQTKVGNNKYYSITNVGEKPTVMDKSCNIETSVGDFSQDIYGKEIEIEFCKYIRCIEKFDSLENLKNQLNKDMKKAESFFRKEDKYE